MRPVLIQLPLVGRWIARLWKTGTEVGAAVVFSTLPTSPWRQRMHSGMKQPTLLGSLLRLACVLASLEGMASVTAADLGQPQYYELRVYSTQSEAQQNRINDYWQQAAVPAYNRLGIAPIGVFTELQDSATNRIFVLIPFATPGAYSALPGQLAADSTYRVAAADYLDAPKADPAYVRFGSSMLVAFDGMKQLAVPASAADMGAWIFELRIYQSRSETTGDNKVRMFNSGEIPLMKEVGLSPVFFGQTLIGSEMPNLVYMVSGENQEAHRAHWKDFFDAAVWKKLIADPQFKDNVSKVVSVFLKRTTASQI